MEIDDVDRDVRYLALTSYARYMLMIWPSIATCAISMIATSYLALATNTISVVSKADSCACSAMDFGWFVSRCI